MDEGCKQHKKKALVIDVSILSDNKFRKKQNVELETYQQLKEEVEKLWKVDASVVLTVCAVTPKLK